MKSDTTSSPLYEYNIINYHYLNLRTNLLCMKSNNDDKTAQNLTLKPSPKRSKAKRNNLNLTLG